jgi:hypothetical protein
MGGPAIARNRFSPPAAAGGGGGGNGINTVNYHTVTAGELAAKSFNLSAVPTGIAISDMIGGGPLEAGVDYNLVGAAFSWNGLGLDGIIAEGDVVRVTFQV